MAKQPPKNPSASKHVTIRDVAKAANLSIGAASAALRDAKSTIGVSRETRARVRRVAQELGYRPNAAARAMAARSFRTIGLVATENCFTSYYSYVTRGIVAQAEELGYNVIVKMVPTIHDLENARIFSEALIDGVVVPALTEEHMREALVRFEIPHVWLNAGVDEPHNCVISDEHQGMRLLVDHLISLGHRRIAYMPGDDPPGYHSLITRENAFLAAMEAHGLEPMPTYSRWINIAEHVDLYLDMDPRPTAIVGGSDAFAAWTVSALLKRGLRVPEDVSVVGSEGVIWHRYIYPTLTTVLGPVHELGRAAVKMLVQHIDTGKPVPSVKLPVTLEVNESTAPPTPES